ncbi:transposase, partial [Mycobacterium tuberculosis TKK-01-0061]
MRWGVESICTQL